MAVTSKTKTIKKISKPGAAAPASRTLDYLPDMPDVMANANYLRQSSALINDALQKGFDVLQMANGDIVLTGTKTVVYRYSWEQKAAKLVKAKTDPAFAKKQKRINVDVDMEDDEEMETGEA